MAEDTAPKTALITGAAQGIGLAIAARLAETGARVVLADLQDDKGHASVAALRQRGFEAEFVHVDLTAEAEIQQMVRTAVALYGRLDILVNNASPFRRKFASYEESLQDWDLHQAVLLKASASAAAFARPHLRQQPGGSIVNIGSIVSSSISAQPCSYHVAKAGLVQLTRWLARELGPEGTRVNCVSPGLVDKDDARPLTADPVHREVVEIVAPLGRAGCPRDIANAVAFLSSEEASYITGQCLVVDGGVTLDETFEAGRRAFRRAAERGA